MLENFKLIFRLIALDAASIQTISKKSSATIDGVLILFLAGIASVIGARKIFEMEEYRQLAFEFNLSNVTFFAIFFVIVSLFYLLFSFFIARSLGGKCEFKAYFRNMALANVINLLNLFVSLSLLTNIWLLIINYQVLTKLNNFSFLKTFLTLFTTFISIFALLILLS